MKNWRNLRDFVSVWKLLVSDVKSLLQVPIVKFEHRELKIEGE